MAHRTYFSLAWVNRWR